jgi:fibronectin-binding autotransporter adhesin
VANSSGNLQTIAMPVQLADLGGPSVPIQWNTGGGNITVSGVISDNNIGLAVSGGNTLTLSGSNTYTGGTTINGATLSANTIADANSSVGPSGSLVLEGGGTLAFTGASGTTARTVSVEGSTTDTINVPTSSSLTLNGQVHSVSDTAAQMLTLTGGGTLNLGGTVDNSGLTMAINTGEVVITKATTSTVHGLGGGTTTVGTGAGGNSAELQLAGSGGFDLFSSCVLTVNTPDGFLDLNGQNDSFGALTLSGAGPNGTGALINSSGTPSAITNSGGVVLAAPASIGGSGNIRLASAVSGAGMSLTYVGSGTLTLSTVGTYGGGTTVAAGGTLQLTAGSTTNSSAGSGTITLNGNAVLDLSMTNTEMNNVIIGGSSNVINIAMGAGNLWLSNSPAGQLNSFSGTFNVSSTVANGGQLVVGTAALAETINSSATWQIQNGTTVDFNVNQNNPATVYLYGLPYIGQADGLLRLDASVQSGSVILMSNSVIGNGNAGTSTISGAISSSGGSYGFVKTGAGPIVLTGTNTYTGFTTISNGTLSLSGTGAISNSSAITIMAGSTFDVSQLTASTFFLSTSNTLNASGTGTTPGSTAATINGATTVDLGSQPIGLTFKPSAFTGDLTHPSLYVAQGTLNLNGNAITVNNAGASPLGVGTYTLISVAGGTISGATPTATVTGNGLAASTSASVQISGGSLNLVVVSTSVSKPVINSVTRSGGNLIFSGTNGPDNGTYTVLTSTNAALPLTNWTSIATNTFSPTGTFSVTNTIGTNTTQYFDIVVP